MTRIAVVDREKCQPTKCHLECVKICPPNRLGEECITISPEPKAVISETLCIDCGLCMKKPMGCPFDAITIVRTPEALKEPPLFQYGRNMFRLFRLPYPKENSVVGIIGSNGAGKSTALKVIAGAFKPNLGRYSQDVSWEDIIREFKGQELQNFFEGLKEGKFKVSLKPQEVDKIPKAAKGKVRALLEKVDERKIAFELVKELELETVLDSNVSELSGGELQRMAVIAALSKEADVYLVDEPSSFLDVRQRLKVARLLKKTAESGKRVVAIEHDLAVLDYMSDYVQVLYGHVGAYGIVSNLKATGIGINQFLEGYLPDENVRFRANEIKFETSAPLDLGKAQTLFHYPSLEKKFTSFDLKVEEGSVRKGEILGVLGPNGIGKTTFVKMLAGVLEADNTKLEHRLKVAYKPQYIETSYEGTVRELISESKLDEELFKNELAPALEIGRLMDNYVKNLSGGELQRLSIALCLGTRADVYLLDEPSAFLDVVQRINAAKLVQRVVQQKGAVGIVIDHDLVFADYVSNRLLVFDGAPGRHGKASSPSEKRPGMNSFLKGMEVTFRRDKGTGRPRANKEGSQLDREQKTSGEYYYTR